MTSPTSPKAAPSAAAPSALTEATDALESSVELRAANVLISLAELDDPIRQLHHLTEIVRDWAINTSLPADAGPESVIQMDRMAFVICEIGDRVRALHRSFREALSPPEGQP
jgi:hypothetical protein